MILPIVSTSWDATYHNLSFLDAGMDGSNDKYEGALDVSRDWVTVRVPWATEDEMIITFPSHNTHWIPRDSPLRWL